MGAFTDELTPAHVKLIKSQHLFYVASAPCSTDGHINITPKGYSTLTIHNPNRVSFLDFVGSGVETLAHVKENGRITLMMCSFGAVPGILRIYGRAKAYQLGTREFNDIVAETELKDSDLHAARCIVDIEVTKVGTSCGYAVPLYEYLRERETLRDWGKKRTSEEIEAYRVNRNGKSIDGLCGWVADQRSVQSSPSFLTRASAMSDIVAAMIRVRKDVWLPVGSFVAGALSVHMIYRLASNGV